MPRGKKAGGTRVTPAAKRTSDERARKLQEVVREINGKYGDQTVVLAARADPDFFHVKTFETGILGLNRVIDLPGLPRRRFVEIFGLNSVGKTSTALWIIAKAMQADPEFLTVYIDTEYRFDLFRAYAFGIDLNRLWLHQTRSGEEAVQVAKEMLRSGVDLVVFDSVTGLLPVRQDEASMGESSFIGLHARLMSDAAKVLTPSMAAYDRSRRGSVLFINQMRDNPGQMFGNPQRPTGGHALEFFASIRLELRSGAKDDWIVDPETGERTGQWIRVHAVKNSLGRPYQSGRYPLLFESGMDLVLDVGNTAADLGIVEKGGAGMYAYQRLDGTEFKARGEAAYLKALAEDVELVTELYERCQARLSPKKVVAAQDKEAEAS